MDAPSPGSEAQNVSPKQRGSGLATQILSGVGLGLLLGMIAGLSVSPVVQVILGALVTVVTGFLGLQAAPADGAASGVLGNLKINEVRIGSFAFACVAGILCGLFIRSNAPFTSITHDVKKWTDAGYSEPEARQNVAFQLLGFKPADKEIVAGDLQKASASGLFAAHGDKFSLCDTLNPKTLNNDPQQSLAMLNQYSSVYDGKLAPLAAEIQKLSPRDQEKLLEANWGVICELEKGK